MNAKKAAAMIAIKADPKDLDRGIAEAKKKLKSFGSSVKKIGGKVWGGAKGALGALGTGFGIQGAGMITDAIGGIRDFERNLVRLQIAAGKTPAEMDAIRQSIFAVSKATGVANEDILAGTQNYVDLTGDIDGATAAMSSFARIAQASGASVSDVSTAAAALQQAMKLDPDDIEAAFSGLIQQGKAGAVSLKDFAGELSSIAPMFAKFGGGAGVTAIADLGAAFQVARKGFGSASEAGTGLKALMTSLSRNADKFQAAGVKIFDKDPKTGAKRFRSFRDIVDQIGASRLAKDPTLLTKAFGSVEAQQAFDMLRANRGELEAIYEAGQDAGAVQRDLDTYLQSSAGRMDVALNNVKLAVVEAFTPERIQKFVEVIEQVVDAIGSMIDGIKRLRDYMPGADALDQNPFGTDKLGEQDLVSVVAAQTQGQTHLPESHPVVQRGREVLANRAAFDAAMGDITGAGSRDEQIRRAVAAATARPTSAAMGGHDERAYNAGGFAGKNTAGQRFLRDNNVSEETVAKIRSEQFARAIADAISKGFAGVSVNMDGSSVAKATNNAPIHRGGGG